MACEPHYYRAADFIVIHGQQNSTKLGIHASVRAYHKTLRLNSPVSAANKFWGQM